MLGTLLAIAALTAQPTTDQTKTEAQPIVSTYVAPGGDRIIEWSCTGSDAGVGFVVLRTLAPGASSVVTEVRDTVCRMATDQYVEGAVYAVRVVRDWQTDPLTKTEP